MDPAAPTYEDIRRAVAAHGLAVRGGFHATEFDRVPAHESGAKSVSLVLVGMTAESGWSAFETARERAQRSNPLDRFSERVIGTLARELAAEALFPFRGPPWLPFQRWAVRAERAAPSPLGLVIHANYGLWHGYRGALSFAHAVTGLPQRVDWRSPCLDCAEQPCLRACPVDAFTAHGFSSAACAGQLGADPEPCLDAGCLSRAACPVAPQARYSLAQRRFHMQAFRDNLLDGQDDD